MYFSLIIIFILFLVIIIAGIQNSMPLELKFFIWDIKMSITALIFYSSVIGGAIIAIMTLPRLVKKSLHVRGLKWEMEKLKKEISETDKEHAGNLPKG
ncbi:MAG: LapA family protein [Deltaproteobacteria bacterium]|nr:LapA family protein [Deltaproteobacteria bacterium]